MPNFANDQRLRKQLLREEAATELEKRLPNVIRPNDYYLRVQPYYPAPGITIPPGNTAFLHHIHIIT